jgi:apolipoprotein D and lipocalin family protein
MKLILFLLSVIFWGCVNIPEGVVPIQDFDVNRYLGKWYEIARLDHSFERGLEEVTAEYSLRQDGGIKVLNRGFNPKKQAWKEAVGKAYFITDSDIGSLKVSFFGPIYGGYHIIALDKTHYTYSLVCGPKKSYLWILARKPVLEQKVKSELIKKATAIGFETEKLIYVKHRQG